MNAKLLQLVLTLSLVLALAACGENPVDPNEALNDTTPPALTVTSPAESAVINADFSIMAQAQDDESGVAQVSFYFNGLLVNADSSFVGQKGLHDYESKLIRLTTITNGTYQVKVVALNAKQLATTNTRTVTVNKGSYAYQPVLAITSPVDGAVVSGSITATATATVTGSTVTNVAFFFNGAFKNNDTTPGFESTSFNTAGLEGQSLTIRAIANAANGRASTNQVVVTVQATNIVDLTPPELAITSPANGATVSGSLVIGANAGDPESSIASVKFYTNDVLVNTDATSAYQSSAIDTTKIPNGSLTLKVVAQNGKGLTSTSTISVTVDNGGNNTVVEGTCVPIGQAGNPFEAPVTVVNTAAPDLQWSMGTVTGVLGVQVEIWDSEGYLLWSVVNVSPSVAQAHYGTVPAGATQLFPATGAPSALANGSRYLMSIFGIDNAVWDNGNQIGVAYSQLDVVLSGGGASRSLATVPVKRISRAEYQLLLAQYRNR